MGNVPSVAERDRLDLDLWPFFYLIIEGNQAAFVVNASRALHRKHHLVTG